MAPDKHYIVESSSSEDEINVDKMVETKQAVDKIRKDRDHKRDQLQEDLDNKLEDLRTRIKQAVEAHNKHLAAAHEKQFDRLIKAVETRDNIEKLIREKLMELRKAGIRLAEELDAGYGHRLDKARSISNPVSGQETNNRDQGCEQQAKRVKFDDSSRSTD